MLVLAVSSLLNAMYFIRTIIRIYTHPQSAAAQALSSVTAGSAAAQGLAAGTAGSAAEVTSRENKKELPTFASGLYYSFIGADCREPVPGAFFLGSRGSH